MEQQGLKPTGLPHGSHCDCVSCGNTSYWRRHMCCKHVFKTVLGLSFFSKGCRVPQSSPLFFHLLY